MMRRSGCARRKGFTLLEVMVVMTIVGVTLVVVILPGLARSAQIARSVGCAKNLSDICRALESYHATYAGVPYNYCDDVHAQGAPDDGLGRWALAYLSRYLGGPTGVRVRPTGPFYENKLVGLDEAQFPNAFICPAADRQAIFYYNPRMKYHASYFTNPAIRVNMGWENWMLSSYTNPDVRPLIWDSGGPTGGGSGGMARFTGKSCPDSMGWRSVYHPIMDSIADPARMAFVGDTNNKGTQGWPPIHTYNPGNFYLQPGFGYISGSLGFDRHGDKLMLGYCDGHTALISRAEVQGNWSVWDPRVPTSYTGDFLVKYPPGPWGCTSAGRERGLHLLGPTIVSGIR